MIQAVLGAAAATIAIAGAGVLLMAPGRTPQRWAVALALGLTGAHAAITLRWVDPTRLARFSTENPWLRWEFDVIALANVAMVAALYLYPTRARFVSLRGALCLVAFTFVGIGAFGWLFDKPLVWDAWPLDGGGSSRFNLLWRVTEQAGLFLTELAILFATLVEMRHAPRSQRGVALSLLVAVLAVPLIESGAGLAFAVKDIVQGNPFMNDALFLTVTPGDCCLISFRLAAAAQVAAWLLAVVLAWRLRSALGLLLVGAGVARVLLTSVTPVGWSFAEAQVVVGTAIVISLAQRRGVFGRFVLPPAVSWAYAGIVATCVFLIVSTYTLEFGVDVVLVAGIFVGIILAIGAAIAVLPPGRVHLPWAPAPSATDGALVAYRGALRAEITGGLSGAPLAEKLRPLRAELGISDRDHAVMSHTLAHDATAKGAGVLEAGDVLLGRYRIERHLGRGGSGAVFLAMDERLGRLVAIKQLSEDQKRDRAALERFHKEMRLASALEHPNVVAVHDIEVVGNEAYLVMEFVPGGSLDERVRERGPLRETDARRVADEILSALAALHARSIVHRDVKPSNILLDAHEHAKLADFSVARAAVSGETLGVAATLGGAGGGVGGAPGTPAFMSPEQARGLPATARSDVYALGASLYAALSGGRPPVDVAGASEMEARIRVASEAPALPLAGVSAAMNTVLAKALAKQPHDRYASADAMRQALAAIAP